MKKIFKFSDLLISVLVLLLFIAAGCSSVPMAPRHAVSKYFRPVSDNLDLGGSLFFYADIEGDVDKAALLIDESLENSDEFVKNLTGKINIANIVKVLGLSQLAAVGMSSVEKGDGFINKSFVAVKGRPEGLLKLFGDTPHSFELTEFAPAGAALAFEGDINLKAAFDSVALIVEGMEGAEGVDKLRSEFSQPLAPGLFTPMDIIKKADTKVMLAVVIDDERSLKIPDEDFHIPYTQVAVSIDNMGFIVDDLAKLVKDSFLFSVNESDRWQTIRLVQKLPGDMSIYSPVIKRDKQNNRLYLSTTSAFLEDCLSGKKHLSDDTAYIDAVKELPVVQGNALSYVSADFMVSMKRLTGELLKQDDDLEFMTKVINGWFTGARSAEASVFTATPNGFYTVSNGRYSHKLTLMALGYLNPLTIGLGAALALPQLFKSPDQGSVEEHASDESLEQQK